MKKLSIILTLLLGVHLSNSQNLNVSANPDVTLQGESAFIDLSAFSSSPNGESRGLNFPQTDLTQFEFQSDGDAFGAFSTFYDGMIVYNTVDGTTPADDGSNLTGVGGQSVDVGFYYFSNPTSASVNGNGEWLPLGTGGGKFTVPTSTTATPVDGTETNALIGSDPENAIRVTGTANGTDTYLAISETAWDLDTVKSLRKCIIYEGDTLIIEATSTFEGGANNRIVTGDGMINLLLPNTAADAYTLECYYTLN